MLTRTKPTQTHFQQKKKKKSELKNLNRKFSGKNGVRHELIKYEGEDLVTKVHNVISIIWRQEKIPRD